MLGKNILIRLFEFLHKRLFLLCVDLMTSAIRLIFTYSLFFIFLEEVLLATNLADLEKVKSVTGLSRST